METLETEQRSMNSWNFKEKKAEFRSSRIYWTAPIQRKRNDEKKKARM